MCGPRPPHTIAYAARMVDWGLIVGAVGSVAAIAAIIYAHIAYRSSKQSTDIAKDSKHLAIEANDLARSCGVVEG